MPKTWKAILSLCLSFLSKMIWEQGHLETRRTRPAYLSEAEAARDRERTERMVKSIMKRKQVSRIGETSNFVVDYDDNERLVMVYGKDVPTECQFKLAFDESETRTVIDLLTKARTFFQGYKTKAKFQSSARQ